MYPETEGTFFHDTFKVRLPLAGAAAAPFTLAGFPYTVIFIFLEAAWYVLFPDALTVMNASPFDTGVTFPLLLTLTILGSLLL